MIKNEYVSYPEFREGFFNLVKAIVTHCPGGLFKLDMGKLNTIILTVLFSIKHEKPECMDIGLETLVSLNDLLMKEP